MSTKDVVIVGAGLAGCEAAWQLAQGGIPVTLYDQKPQSKSPAHHLDGFGELVCSNSLKADGTENAAGLLKWELRQGASLLLACADGCTVPAGGALAVDRDKFSALITAHMKGHPLITVIENQEIQSFPPDFYDNHQVILATGPLTTSALAEYIQNVMPPEAQKEALFFFDAAAPIVSFDSIDMSKAYFATRYDKGTPDYINCPMNKEEYLHFWAELCQGEEAPVHGFEAKHLFEGCMPVEEVGKRGEETLLFGCLKPVGLPDPKTGKDPYAVVQLRKENSQGSMYNLVGFQTHLKFGEQQRIFSLIPALADAEFLRYGVMHRNTYLDSPRVLNSCYQLRNQEDLMFAGQITGVEGYVESIASGWLCARELLRRRQGKEPLALPRETAIGALAYYISDPTVGHFQPMKMQFGLVPDLAQRVKGGKRVRNQLKAQRGMEVFLAHMGQKEEAMGDCPLSHTVE